MTDLSDLEPLAKRLNAASDELNQALQTIQDKLNALGVGVEAWLDTPIAQSAWREVLDRDNESTGRRECGADELGYGRLGDGWALLVRKRRYVEDEHGDVDEYDDDIEVKPLLRAARNLRVMAVPRIPDLIEKLRAEAKNVIDNVERAKQIAESLK